MSLQSKKIVPVLLLLLSTSLGLFAQVSRSTFSISGGYSLPVGKFASEKLDDPKAGLAGSGYFGQAAYELRFVPWLGLRLSGSHNINSTNSEPIIMKANELIDMYRGVINEWGTYTWENHAGKWQLSSLMAGPVIYIHLGRLQLTGHVQGGRMFMKSPKVTLAGTSTSGNNAVTALMEPVRTEAWGMGGGVSIRIPVSQAVRFQLSADAMACHARFKDISLKGKIGDFEASRLMEEARPVGIVNVGAGFVVDF